MKVSKGKFKDHFACKEKKGNYVKSQYNDDNDDDDDDSNNDNDSLDHFTCREKMEIGLKSK